MDFFFLDYFFFQEAKFNDGKLHVVFCNVGQGDAIFIRTTKGFDILVDGGPASWQGSQNPVLDCLSRHMPFWDRDLELVFATHPDADHIGGLEAVLKSYTVKSLNTSKKTKGTQIFARIQGLIDAKRIPLRFIYSGDSFSFSDGLKIEGLWPSLTYVESDTAGKLDANSFSLVQVLSFGEFKTLLTGDIEYQILDTFFSPNTKIDVFKLPHHGSKTGVDDLTFQKIKSKLSIISVGKNNKYNHPSSGVLEFLNKYAVSYKRTDLNGEAEIVSDGKTWSLVSN